MLIAGADHVAVAQRPARLHNVAHPGAPCHVDAVAVREEAVRGQHRAVQPGQPLAALVGGQRRRHLRHLRAQPGIVGDLHPAHVLGHPGVAVVAAHAGAEPHVAQHRMKAQVPGARLVDGELGAVDARLLAGADADRLAAVHDAHRVGLGVLQDDQREQHVARHRRRDVPRRGGDVGQQIAADGGGVAGLLQGHAEHLAPLGGRRPVVGDRPPARGRRRPSWRAPLPMRHRSSRGR